MAKRKSPDVRRAPLRCSRSVLLLARGALRRRRLAEAMRDAGFVVDGCRSSKVAVERVSRRHYDALVVDDGDACEALELLLARIRRNRLDTRLIVIESAPRPTRRRAESDRVDRIPRSDDPCALLYRLQRTVATRLERELRNTQAWFAAVLEYSPTEISLQDLDGRYLRVNRRAAQRVGLDAARMIGKRVDQVLPALAARRLQAQDAEVMRDGAPSVREHPLLQGREEHLLSVLKFPVRDGDGRLLGVGSVATEIGDPKTSATAKLRAALDYRWLYDGAPDMYFSVAADGEVLSVNRYGAGYLGYRTDELIGTPFWKLVHPDDRSRVEHRFTDLCKQGATDGGRYELEFRQRRRDGKTLWLQGRVRVVLDPAGDSPLVHIACRDVSEAHDLANRLSYQASHDPLTGLLNRRALEERLQRVFDTARRDASENALCYLDLDQFKLINDSCGHAAGDELLRQLGELMPVWVRKRDTLARIGGDEFAVLLERCSLPQALRVVNALRNGLQAYNFFWQGRRFTIGASIGIVAVGRASGDPESILAAADSACYVAKARGRNRVHVYREDDADLVRHQTEMAWAARIEKALGSGDLCLYAQPIKALPEARSARVDKTRWLELLPRIRESTGAIIEPAVLLPVARRYRLIERIDRWVVRAALEWLAPIPDPRQPRRCSINLSGASLADEAFLGDVLESFAGSSVATEKLCFELTEADAVAGLASARRFIQAVKSWGCHFALDEFGSGIASFGYLKRLPVDILKIDGALVEDIADDPMDLAVVRAIHDVARVAGLETVAEHVTGRRVLDKLATIGVDYVQGHAIGRPYLVRRMPG